MYLGLTHFSLISSFINSVSFYYDMVNSDGLKCMKQDKVDKGGAILIQIYLNILTKMRLSFSGQGVLGHPALGSTVLGLGGLGWQPWIWGNPNHGLYSLNTKMVRV